MPRVYYLGTEQDGVREVQVGGNVLTWFPRHCNYKLNKNVVKQTFKDRYGKTRTVIGNAWELVDRDGPSVHYRDLTAEEWEHAQLNRYNLDKKLTLQKPEQTIAEKKAELARLQAEIESAENKQVTVTPKVFGKKKSED